MRPKQWKTDIRFGIWNFRSLYRLDSLTTAAARELARYKLHSVGLQKVRLHKGGSVREGDCNFFYGKGNENRQLGAGFFVHHKTVSAGKKIKSVRDRMSYIVLKCPWYITVLIAH